MPSPEVLIGSRVLQGLFAAVMIPQCFGLIRDVFPPQEIGKAFAAFGPVIGLSTVLGPIVAGLLIEADAFGTGWRMIFLINLPLGIWAMVTGNKVLPDNAPTHRSARLDALGVVLAGLDVRDAGGVVAGARRIRGVSVAAQVDGSAVSSGPIAYTFAVSA